MNHQTVDRTHRRSLSAPAEGHTSTKRPFQTRLFKV